MPKIKSGDIEISYQTYGDGDPLLLIMGFGAPGAAWLPVLPLLPGFKCIYFDNRGTGDSDKPAGSYTISQMADDASNLLEALGIAKAKVLGVSMGGMIAQELTLRHPDQVERVVLGCTTPGGPTALRAPDTETDKLIESLDLVASGNYDAAIEMVMPLLFPQDFIAAHPELRQFMMGGLKMGPPPPRAILESTRAGALEFDAYDRLSQITCPVLIVHGDKDLLVPEANANLLKQRIPHAELMMIPNAGHSFAAPDPVGIYYRIVQWLKGQPADSAMPA